MSFLGCLTEPGALLCGSEGEELCSMLVYSQHYDCVTVYLHRFLQEGHWPVPGYIHVLQGSTVYYCSAM